MDQLTNPNPKPSSRVPLIIGVALVSALVTGAGVYAWHWMQQEKLTKEHNTALHSLELQNQEFRNTIADLKKDSDSDTTPTDDQSTPPTPKTTTFENADMNITVSEGWTSTKSGTSAVNITKDSYILYINPNTTQASGVEGGRFSEIAQGSPSADLVIKAHPGGPCGVQEKSDVTTDLTRFDFFIDKTTTQADCNTVSDTTTRWYFSYVSTSNGDYLGSVSALLPSASNLRKFAITMSVNASSLQKLPEKKDTDRQAMIQEMTDMVKTLQFK